MTWKIVPRTARKRELVYDEELVAGLLNDETFEYEGKFNRRLYQNVATENGYRLRTLNDKKRGLVIWFEKVEREPAPIGKGIAIIDPNTPFIAPSPTKVKT